ncbi:hypothetical protein AAHC03_026615 [Spirometra sp. Aus1]
MSLEDARPSVILCGPCGFRLQGGLQMSISGFKVVSADGTFSVKCREIDSLSPLTKSTQRRYPQVGPGWFTLSIGTKELLIYELSVQTNEELYRIYQTLNDYCNRENASLLYAMNYKPDFTIEEDGWHIFSLKREFANLLNIGECRISSVNADYSICPSYPREILTLSSISDDLLRESAQSRRDGRFPIITYHHPSKSTYIAICAEALPAPRVAVGKAALEATSESPPPPGEFRPAAAGLQTSTVVASKCRVDEQLLAALLPPSRRGTIIDLRVAQSKKKSAVGMEMDQFNPQWKRLSRPITEPSDIRSIFREFIQAYTRPCSLQQPGSKPPSAMSSLLQFTGASGGSGGNGDPTASPADASSEMGAEAMEGSVGKVSLKRTTGWLSLLLEALTAAVAAAAALDGQDAAAQQQLQQEKLLCQTADASSHSATTGSAGAEMQERLAGMQTQGACVLVLGQQGRDRTLLVSSLAQIILAPGVRTIRGFEALIYRDWLLAGHPFGETCRHSAFSVSISQRDSPIFLLFLDCVWQIWCQYPSCFEFNEDFLIFLAKHVYVSEFGTFLGNSEQDREKLELSSKTFSLWSYVNRPEVLADFLNPLYSPPPAETDGSSASTACWPCLAPQALTVWTEVYQKQLLGSGQKSLAAHRQLLSQLYRDFTDTKLTVHRLRQIVSHLQEEAISTGLLPTTA